jgi:hypothetical protein
MVRRFTIPLCLVTVFTLTAATPVLAAPSIT